MSHITINKLHLRNFLSHEDTELVLDKGVTVFVGPNGAGKSSILEAIYYAVTGKGWRTRGNERKPLIRAGASTALIEAWFSEGGRSLYIKRTISRKGRTETEVRLDNEVIRSDSDASVRLREFFGLDWDALRMVGILPQGGITTLFVDLRGSERKALIDRLLGIQAYEDVWRALGDYVVEKSTRRLGTHSVTPTDNSLNLLKRNLRKYAETVIEKKEEYARTISRRKALEGRIGELSLRAGELRKRLEKIEGEVQRLSALEGEAGKIEGELKHLKELLDQTKAKRKSVEAELASIKNALSGIDELRAKANLVDPIKKLIEVEDRLARVKKDLASRREELIRLKEGFRKLQDLRSSLKEENPEKIAESLQTLKMKREELESRATNLERAVAEAETSMKLLEGDIASLKGEVEGVMEGFRKLLGSEFNDLESAGIALKNELIRLEKVRDELSQKVRKLTEVKASSEERIREAERNLKALTEGGMEGRCPLCGQTLTREHARKVEERLRDEIRKAEEEVKKAESNLKEVLEKLNTVEERINLLHSYIPKAEEALSLMKELVEKGEYLKSIKGELQDKVNELKRVREELNQMREEEAALEARLKDALTLQNLKELIDEERLITLENEVAALEDELRMLEDVKTQLHSKIGGYLNLSEGLNKALEDALKAAEELERLKVLEGKGKALEVQAEELIAEEERVNSRIKELESKYATLKEQLERRESLEKEYDDVTREVTEVEKQISQAVGSLNILKEREESLRQEIQEMQDDLRDLLDLWFKVEVLRWLRNNVFYRDKAPKELRKVYVSRAEELVREYLNSFNMQYSDVRIDEEFNIYLKSPATPGEGIEIGRLSGGEKVITSLISLLALHKIVSRGRLGFLALDEPTEYLDEERRKLLIDVLKEFKGGEHINQLIIVTHDDEVKAAADTMFEVVNQGGSSTVREVELYE